MKMQMWHARLVRVVLMIGCDVGLMSGPAVAQTYTVTDVGTLGGTQTNGVAINANGQVTGDALTAGNHQRHGFLASDGVATDIGTLGGVYSLGIAINAAGQVTGGSTIAGDTEQHPFLYSGGVMTDLGTLGGRHGNGLAINASGQVAGAAEALNATDSHAFLYSGGVMTDLGTLGGTFSTGPSTPPDKWQALRTRRTTARRTPSDTAAAS
jgi:probable HAF family extracellular repeat protein